MTPLVRQMSALVPEPELAMWFDLGEVPSHVPADRIAWDDVRHMPYQRTCAVFTTRGETGRCTRYAAWILTGDASITLAYIALADGMPAIFSKPLAIMEVEGELRYMVGDKEPADRKAVQNTGRVLVTIVQRIHGHNTAYQPAAQGTPAQQAKRKRHGKAPLFSWHTVTVGPPTVKESLTTGGTHASPRRHQCRGHWRNLKSGKRVWVKDCWRGDASKGTVFKDYKAATDDPVAA